MTEQVEATKNLADQIKERVRRADEDRIAKRADAAAAVAAKLQEREQLAKRLTDIDAELTTLVAHATNDLMAAAELADFVGVKLADLPVKATRRAPRKRRTTAAE